MTIVANILAGISLFLVISSVVLLFGFLIRVLFDIKGGKL